MGKALRAALLEAWSVLAPTECAGCGRRDRALCAGCRAELDAAAPRRESLARADGSELALWRAFDYAGAPRSILLAAKDGGRTDVVPALAAVLRRLVRAALIEAAPGIPGAVGLAAIPSSRAAYRRRGYAPLGLLLSRAGYRDAKLLRAVRQTADQAGLSTADRHANRAGSLAVRGGSGVRAVLIVDDIVTTGATLLEADRAFREAGVIPLGAVALAHTPRRFPALQQRPIHRENARDFLGSEG